MAENIYMGKGTRKTSVAQVRIKPGSGNMTINGRKMLEYLSRQNLVTHALEPLEEVKLVGKIDIEVRATGGGLSGQAGAIRLGLARALIKYDGELRGSLKKMGLLTRDPRMVERKKYGQAKARKRFQFSKR